MPPLFVYADSEGMRTMKRLLPTILGLVVAMATAVPVAAAPPPDLIPLPDGFAPEGITAGYGNEAFAGSLSTGGVVRIDLTTGAVETAVPAQPGRVAVGMDHDPRSGNLYVAGGPTGQGYVYDPDTGATLAVHDFGGGFVNDVIVTRDAAWFTESFAPVLYKVPLGPAGAPAGPAETVPLGGDFTFVAGEFNTNGIEATPNGKTLIIVNSATGTLYTIDPAGGDATEIDLGGDSVASGDGILLLGRDLYVVQNFLNQIAEVRLSPDLASGAVTDVITDSDFDIPTTVMSFADGLYVVNARFTTPVTPATEYDAVRVDR